MKKNILSLVAFMAFSVSAFANTVEVKEEVVVESKIEVATVVDCYEYASNQEALFAPGGGGGFWGYLIFEYSYQFCTFAYNCPTCIDEVIVSN